MITQPAITQVVADMTGLGSDEMNALEPIGDEAAAQPACAPAA